MIKIIAIQCFDSRLSAIIIASLGIPNLVTYTTRKAYEDEVDGLDYYFVSKAEFAKLSMEENFAEISTFEDDLYGLPNSLETIDKATCLLVTPESGDYLRRIYGEECLVLGVSLTWEYVVSRNKKNGLLKSTINKQKKAHLSRLDNLNTCDLVLNVSDDNLKQISYIVNSISKLLL